MACGVKPDLPLRLDILEDEGQASKFYRTQLSQASYSWPSMARQLLEQVAKLVTIEVGCLSLSYTHSRHN